MTIPKVIIASQQRSGCIMCGRCCRRFHVRIEPRERDRIASLDWKGKPFARDFSTTINGYEYFRRKPDGGCVFLDDKGVCTIHAQFGYDVKALTCRGYPMNIVSTFPGEVSVMARLDCPAVLSNEGTPLPGQRKDVESLVAEMTFGRHFTESQLCGLTRQTLETIRDKVANLVLSSQAPIPNLILAALKLLDALEKLGSAFLNDATTMKEVWPALLKRFKPEAEVKPRKASLSAYSKLIFRTWLAAYCRRDEEILDRGMLSRLKLFKSNLAFISEHGSWKRLGDEHPDFPFKQARIFEAKPTTNPAEDTWIPFRRFLQPRFETLQFFGAAFYDTDFFTGLKALLKAYAHVLASARYHARANGRDEITQPDVFNAVLSVDHCHGRSPSLRTPLSRNNENFFDVQRFEKLLETLGWW